MKYLADTMAIVLLLEGRQMPPLAQEILSDAMLGKHMVYISAITLFEIGYLHERQRIKASIRDVTSLPGEGFNLLDLNLDFIESAFLIKDIPELHDRLIAGTAKQLDIPVLTNDPVILRSEFVTTVWK